MKKFLIPFLLLFLIAKENRAQDYSTYNHGELPGSYLGFGGGINSQSGIIGIRLDKRISPSTLLSFNAGVGSWGPKISIGGIFLAKSENGFCPFISLSRCMGSDEVTMNLKTVSGTFTSNKDVRLYLKAATLINLGGQYQWLSARGNRTVLEFGYSFPIVEGSYSVLDPVFLAKESSDALAVLRPGGMMLGLAYQFGLKKK